MATILRSLRYGSLSRKLLIFDSIDSIAHHGKNSTRSSYFRTSAFLNVKGTNIKMPSLSPTMTVGSIVKWYKKEGDIISPGDVLCDIQTDKAVMSFEIEEEGVLAKVLIPEGSNEIEVGTLIGVIVNEGEDWRYVDIPIDSQCASDVDANSRNEICDVQSIAMPSLSPTMTEGTIVKWCKKEGDTVAPGDVLCEIQTDKAVMSFETEEEGILAKILISEGSSGIQVGSLIALLVPEGEDWQNVKIPSSPTDSKKIKSSNDEIRLKQMDAIVTAKERKTYGPAVRNLLELYQIDASCVRATGRNNKLLKSDVLAHITQNRLQPKLTGIPVTTSLSSQISNELSFKKKLMVKYTDVELSTMRKTIANRLTISKNTIPHAYATVNSEIDELLSVRKQMKLAGINVSVNDFVIKAVALALEQCPHINALYINDEVVHATDIDISVAVATESGLITPIVKNANEKSVDEISNDVKNLANKARLGRLQLHEFQGGSFTISNLGMFQISEFSAIINPPQCAILAVGGGRPYVDASKNAKIKMTSTLSYNSRAVSDSAAADFLESLQWLLHHPVNIIVSSARKIAKKYV